MYCTFPFTAQFAKRVSNWSRGAKLNCAESPQWILIIWWAMKEQQMTPSSGDQAEVRSWRMSMKKMAPTSKKAWTGVNFFLTVVNSEESMLGQYNLWLTYEIANCDGIHKPFDMSNVLSLVNPIHMSLFSDTSSISGMVCPNTENSDVIPFLYK